MNSPSETPDRRAAPVTANPVVHVEIPVTDMERARGFYEDVMGLRFSRRKVDGYDMAFAEHEPGASGASLALAKGDVYAPGKTGPVIYFDLSDIPRVIARALARGGRVLYPPTLVADVGLVAEIEDSEGNRIGLTSAAD
jgi:uncharacterized protein